MVSNTIVKTPTITVLIPCYNGAKWIDRCFDGLRYQGIENFNIVFCDDKSTDNSLKIAKKWKRIFKNLEIVENKKNVGLAHVRNILLSHVKTEYFIFLDVDDVFPEDTLYNLCQPIIDDNKRYDIIVGKIRVCFFNKNQQKIIATPLPASNNYTKRVHDPRQWLLKNINVGVWGKLINKKYWDSLNFEFLNGKNFEDLVIEFYMIFEAKEFCAIPISTYIYSRHTGTISAFDRFSQKNFDDFKFQIYALMKSFENDKRFQNDENKKILSSWFSAISTIIGAWGNICKKRPETKRAFNKFKLGFAYRFIYKSKQDVRSPTNWWSCFTHLNFKGLFAKEIRYWKRKLNKKK
ncbi:MAG: glycosyltransferase family 2 protein [Malacoplasma sp.]|nr:glycosyltransferase family 2 protein [Malacoplasma sp.]